CSATAPTAAATSGRTARCWSSGGPGWRRHVSCSSRAGAEHEPCLELVSKCLAASDASGICVDRRFLPTVASPWLATALAQDDDPVSRPDDLWICASPRNRPLLAHRSSSIHDSF